jgi:hypothetical protein
MRREVVEMLHGIVICKNLQNCANLANIYFRIPFNLCTWFISFHPLTLLFANRSELRGKIGGKAGSPLGDDVPNPVEAGNRSLVVWPGGVVAHSSKTTHG